MVTGLNYIDENNIIHNCDLVNVCANQINLMLLENGIEKEINHSVIFLSIPLPQNMRDEYSTNPFKIRYGNQNNCTSSLL